MFKKISLSHLFLLFVMVFTISCSDTRPEKLLVNFSDDLNSSTVGLNRNLQVHVFANYDDDSQEDVTASMLWSSSNTKVATVADGLISTTSQAGDVTISYKTESNTTDGSAFFEKSFPLHVKPLELVKIELSKNSVVLYEGEKYQMKAEGLFEDNETSEVFYQDITNDSTWMSNNSDIAYMNNSDKKGLLTGVSEGFTTLTVSNLQYSVSAEVEVQKVLYTQIELQSSKESFNVEQTLELQAIALSSDSQEVLLDGDALEWSSSDSDIVSLNKNIATALQSGEVTITATLKENNELTASLHLIVDKEKYMRLFKNGVEVEFPFAQTTEYSTLPSTLDSYTLCAVGQSFTISNLKVEDFSGVEVTTLEASFDGIFEGEVIAEDTNITYRLLQNTTRKELHYFYTIDDAFNNSFSQKYKELD